MALQPVPTAPECSNTPVSKKNSLQKASPSQSYGHLLQQTKFLEKLQLKLEVRQLSPPNLESAPYLAPPPTEPPNSGASG